MNRIYHISVIIHTNNGNYNASIPTYYVEDEHIPYVVEEWLQNNKVDYESWEYAKGE